MSIGKEALELLGIDLPEGDPTERLYFLIDELFDSPQRFAEWARQPNKGFEGRRPVDLLSSDEDRIEVVEALDLVSSGGVF